MELKKSTFLVKKINTKFTDLNTEEYERLFLDLKSAGKVIGTFGEYSWEIPDIKVNDYPWIINFDLEIYKELNTALKAFVLLQIKNDSNPHLIGNMLYRLKRVILKTNGLNDIRKLEIYLEELNITTKNVAYVTALDIKKFLEFYPIKNFQTILELCSKHNKHKKESRDLPNFEDVMIFDEIVNDYFQTYAEEETLKYLPIFVWWLITNILPLRISEFLLIKKECLIEDKDNYSPYKIIVPRLKNKENEEIIYQLVDIDEKAYKLMKSSIKRINEINPDSEYLFPVSLLYVDKNPGKGKKNKRINRRDFDSLKKMFYEEIVEGKYFHYNLERIKNGDTRHFAIINMALQGFNMLSIARMAGHTEIKTQNNYYSHAEHFVQSYVYRLARFRYENKISLKMNSGIIGWKRYIYDKGLSFTENQDDDKSVGRISYGICTELKISFPNNCIEECKYCPNFIFKPAINERDEAINMLSDEAISLEQKIHESIELMKNISKSLSGSLRQGNSDLLKSTSRQLVKYMDQKVIIESALMEHHNYEEQ